jgi:dephospho-CoA kinase
MVKVAVTGGIGSGKSYVCRLIERRGIHVYDCDSAAKRIMASSDEIKAALCRVVGDDVLSEGRIDKAVLASYLLKSEKNAQQINRIVHPAVAEDFISSGYSWMECAILFSSGFDKLVDKVVCVTAPLEVRVDRIVRRDNISRDNALEWIGRQMPQEKVKTLSDYEIVNDGVMDVDIQIDKILASISGFDADCK